MLERSMKLFKPFGIEVRVHWSWALLAVLVASSLATGWFPNVSPGHSASVYWIAGFISAVGLFFSIVVHEFCHALVGRRYRLPVQRITMFLFGGVAHLDEEPDSPGAEFLMAIAGPLASVALAVLFAIPAFFELPMPTLALAIFSYLASINVVVAVFNMLPGYPLDGGRVLRAVLWHFKGDRLWATRIAAGTGQFLGLALIALGFVSFFRGAGVSGLWSILLGFLLMSFARASYVQLVVRSALHGKPARSFMTPASELSSESAGHEISRLFTPDHRIAGDTDAEAALLQMERTGHHELLVVDDDRLLGVVSETALLKSLAAPTPAS